MATKKETTKETTTTKKSTRKTTAKAIDVPDGKDNLIAQMQEQLLAMQKQIETLTAQKAELSAVSTPQIISVAADTEKVMFLWQAQVADDNVVNFGAGGMYGRIVGKTGSFYVPKNDLSRIMTAEVRGFIDKRWLIVVSGMTDDEREAFGVAYKEGELLDKKAFSKMIDLQDEMISIYPNLCDSHKEMVAKCYYEAWMHRTADVRRDVVLALYKIDPNPAFKKILEGMNEAELV